MTSIEATIRSGFRVYKHKIIAPTPSVAPSRNVFRAADFNFASSLSRTTLCLSNSGITFSHYTMPRELQKWEKIHETSLTEWGSILLF